jgi:hypothetical protein
MLVAVRATRAIAGTVTQPSWIGRPNRSRASTSDRAMPGSPMASQSVRSASRNASLGTGMDHRNSRLPSDFAWLTCIGTITSPTVISATAGAPVAR